MNTYNQNGASELLTSFLDGELNSTEESLLFEKIAQNRDLLDDMKHQLMIKEAVKSDYEAFTPPMSAVTGVFSSLGYSHPAATSKPASNFRMKPLFRRVMPLALLLLSSFGIYYLLNSDILSSDSQISNLKNNGSSISAKADNNIVPVVSSTETGDIVKVNKKIKSVAHRNIVTSNDNIAVNIKEELSNSTITVDNTIINDENISADIISHTIDNSVTENYRFNIGQGVSFGSNSVLSSSKPKLGNWDDKNEMKLYVKGLNNISDNSNIFSNYSLGLNFLSKFNFKGGFEVGQQNYNVLVTDSQNENIIPESRMIFWYAATVRYDATQLSFMHITPYLQGAIGSGNFGKYMLRYSIGAEYMPFEDGIGIYAGYEGSNLWYSTQNKGYNSEAGGIIFGLSWKF